MTAQDFLCKAQPPGGATDLKHLRRFAACVSVKFKPRADALGLGRELSLLCICS